MTTHSFPPRLTDDEYRALVTFTREWQHSTFDAVKHLGSRGLLEMEYAVNSFSGACFPTFRYRLSRRGELMRQRYEKAWVAV